MKKVAEVLFSLTDHYIWLYFRAYPCLPFFFLPAKGSNKRTVVDDCHRNEQIEWKTTGSSDCSSRWGAWLGSRDDWGTKGRSRQHHEGDEGEGWERKGLYRKPLLKTKDKWARAERGLGHARVKDVAPKPQWDRERAHQARHHAQRGRAQQENVSSIR